MCDTDFTKSELDEAQEVVHARRRLAGFAATTTTVVAAVVTTGCLVEWPLAIAEGALALVTARMLSQPNLSPDERQERREMAVPLASPAVARQALKRRAHKTYVDIPICAIFG